MVGFHILRTILTKRRFFCQNFAIEICLEQLPQLSMIQTNEWKVHEVLIVTFQYLWIALTPHSLNLKYLL